MYSEHTHNWVTRLLDAFGCFLPSSWVWRRRVLAAAMIGAVIYVSGWLFAQWKGFSSDYVATPAIRDLCFAITWVLASVHWGLEQLPGVITEFATCLKDRWCLEKWKKTFASNTGMLITGVLLWGTGVVFVYSGMLNIELPADANMTVWWCSALPRSGPLRHILPPSWYDPPLVPKFQLLLYLGACASLAGGAGLWLFVVNLPFLRSAMSCDVIFLPKILLAKFRAITDFYFISTLAWFVGVFAVVFISFTNVAALIQVLVLSSLTGC